MHRTHKCHKPAHQGGKHHTLAKSREGDRNKMYHLPILFVMGMGMVTRAAKKKLGAKDGLRDLSSTDHRLYGRSYSNNNNISEDP